MIVNISFRIQLFKTYLIIFFILLSKLAEATHIVGGEIYYDNLGNNNYKLNMKVYRDCINGSPFAPFEGFPDPDGNINPAVFTVFDLNGNVIQTGIFTPLIKTNVPPTNNSPCAPATSGNACVEEAIYEAYITLPPLTGGYYIAYQRCCRNGTILNLVNPGGVGATYWEHIPGPEIVAINSSPRFTLRPPTYICSNLPIAFDHIATDPDGDSLVYTMCTPFNGLSPACPLINLSGANGCPFTNEAPPYIGVPFIAPYSSSYPLASNPAININPATGFLNGNPTIQGQWVVGVCVEEFRNGILIGTHHRDFQFNVIACPFVVAADIVSQVTTNNGQGTGFCNGYTVTYSNNSFNGSTYHWDFGDTLRTDDTSNVYNPTYTFTNSGTYTVTLIVDPGSPCSDTTKKVFVIAPLFLPSFIQPNAQCLNNNIFNFNATGSFQSNDQFSWSFGANASPPIANTPTVTNVTFNTPGTFPISLTVSENNCTVVATKTITVWQNPIANIGSFITSGCVPLTVPFSNQSTAGTSLNYLWEFSNGTTSTGTNPVITFTQPGVYSVSLTASTSSQCIDTSKVTAVNTITVSAIPTASFNLVSSTGVCFVNNSLNYTNLSTASSTANYTWNFGSFANPSTSNSFNVSDVKYNAPGLFSTTLTVSDPGCSRDIVKSFSLYQNPIAGIATFPNAGCLPLVVPFTSNSVPSSGLSYLWNFGDGSTSNLSNPTKTYNQEGVYPITLTVSTTTGCIGTSTLIANDSVKVFDTPGAAFSYVSLSGLCFNNNTINLINNSVFTGNVTHLWDFGSNATPINSTLYNPGSISYNAPGTYTITLTETKKTCSKTDVKIIELYENPVANIGNYTVLGCDPLKIEFDNKSTSASPLTYLWQFSDGSTSTAANPSHIFTPAGVYNVTLTINTNSKCIDNNKTIAVNSITVNPSPSAFFSYITDDSAVIICADNSSSDVISWYYDFGDGKTSTITNPNHLYTQIGNYDIYETVTNSYGCTDTHIQQVKVIPEFAFWIPNSFTPGKNDGLNDIFKPVVFGVENYTFMIFNRWGQLIYKTNDITEGWDGTFKGAASPFDVYVWKCDFTNLVTKQEENRVGHVTLVR